MASHQLKASRLLRRLDASIEEAQRQHHHPLAADCLRAERAVYLARQGAAAQADAVLRDLRRRYEAQPKFAISAWINLCEGIASHFSDMGATAADKIRRAHALAQAAGGAPLCALTAAWSAHMDYLDAGFEAMARHLLQAFAKAGAGQQAEPTRPAQPPQHGALARASLVVAQALHVAGRFDLARPWYEATRQHALDDGDDATLSALLHNAAWLRAAELRQAVLLHGRPVDADRSEHTLMSAESTEYFDRIVGATSLQSLAPLLQAQILSVLGRPQEAIDRYDRHFDAARGQGVGRTIEADLLADRAWCHLAVGDEEAARRHAAAALARIDPQSHCVDRVLAHKRLAQVFAALGDPAVARAQEAATAAAWEGHRREQARILAALADLLSTHAPRGASAAKPGTDPAGG